MWFGRVWLCVYKYIYFIIAFKLVTATQPAEMSSVKLVTWIPCFWDITFLISQILSGHPACSLWCPPLLLDFLKKCLMLTCCLWWTFRWILFSKALSTWFWASVFKGIVFQLNMFCLYSDPLYKRLVKEVGKTHWDEGFVFFLINW